MNRCVSKLTVMFEAPFWIGLYERDDNGKYQVCKIIFGAEPKDNEVYEYMLKNWNRLLFSPPIKNKPVKIQNINPKRMQWQIKKELQSGSIGTKAQQALKLSREQCKLICKDKGRQRREEEKERQFELHRQKRKEKHKGH